jgi:hypothetical protein
MQRPSNSPFVELLNAIVTFSVENPHEMSEYCFPYSKFKFVKEINNEHGVEIEAEFGEGSRECIL